MHKTLRRTVGLLFQNCDIKKAETVMPTDKTAIVKTFYPVAKCLLSTIKCDSQPPFIIVEYPGYTVN